MYKILSNQPGRLALLVADFITADDYYDLRPLLDTALHSAPFPRLYWEMEYFRGWQPDELWRDLQFDLTVTADFARIAVVGTAADLSLIIPAMEAIFRAERRSFSPDQKLLAWDWFTEAEPAVPVRPIS
jgi:hypothetical protein